MLKGFLKTSAILLLTASVALTGCGGKKTTGDGEDTSKGEAKKTIAMVTDTGGIHDNSFNQSAWEGMQKLESDKGVKIAYKESKADADYIPNLTTFAKGKNEITWGVGYLMGDSVKKVAESNADKKFGIIDFSWGPDTPKNVAAVVFKEHEGSYLVGVVAGLMTKSKKIGFIGGVEGDLIKKFEYGFKAGVKAVNPEAVVSTNYVGSFADPQGGKTAAASMYNNGTDIIYHASGGTGNGVFQEAKEQKGNGKDVWVIGVDRDQSDLGPDVTLTSMIKRVDNAVYEISEKAISGDFPGGETTEFGLKENGVGIAETSKNHVPQDVLDKVKEYQDKIVNGDITVPATEADFKAAK